MTTKEFKKLGKIILLLNLLILSTFNHEDKGTNSDLKSKSCDQVSIKRDQKKKLKAYLQSALKMPSNSKYCRMCFKMCDFRKQNSSSNLQNYFPPKKFNSARNRKKNRYSFRKLDLNRKKSFRKKRNGFSSKFVHQNFRRRNQKLRNFYSGYGTNCTSKKRKRRIFKNRFDKKRFFTGSFNRIKQKNYWNSKFKDRRYKRKKNLRTRTKNQRRKKLHRVFKARSHFQGRTGLENNSRDIDLKENIMKQINNNKGLIKNRESEMKKEINNLNAKKQLKIQEFLRNKNLVHKTHNRTQKIDFQNEEVKHVNNEEKNILQKLDHMIPFEKSTFSHQKLNQSISRAICKPLKNMDVKSNSNDKERERLANLNSNFEVKKDNSIDTNRKVKRRQRTFSTNQKSNKNHKKKKTSVDKKHNQNFFQMIDIPSTVLNANFVNDLESHIKNNSSRIKQVRKHKRRKILDNKFVTFQQHDFGKAVQKHINQSLNKQTNRKEMKDPQISKKKKKYKSIKTVDNKQKIIPNNKFDETPHYKIDPDINSKLDFNSQSKSHDNSKFLSEESNHSHIKYSFRTRNENSKSSMKKNNTRKNELIKPDNILVNDQFLIEPKDINDLMKGIAKEKVLRKEKELQKRPSQNEFDILGSNRPPIKKVSHFKKQSEDLSQSPSFILPEKIDRNSEKNKIKSESNNSSENSENQDLKLNFVLIGSTNERKEKTSQKVQNKSENQSNKTQNNKDIKIKYSKRVFGEDNKIKRKSGVQRVSHHIKTKHNANSNTKYLENVDSKFNRNNNSHESKIQNQNYSNDLSWKNSLESKRKTFDSQNSYNKTFNYPSKFIRKYAQNNFHLVKSLNSKNNIMSRQQSIRIRKLFKQKNNHSFKFITKQNETHLVTVKSVFSIYEEEYTSIYKHIASWKFENGQITTLNNSGSRVILNKIILGVWLHKYKFLLKFIGRIRIKSERDHSIIYECFDSNGISVRTFTIRSFNVEFMSLLSYFIQHTNRIQQNGDSFGFYDWFGHWVEIHDYSFIEILISIVSQYSDYYDNISHSYKRISKLGSGLASLANSMDNLNSSMLDTYNKSNHHVVNVIRRSPRIGFGSRSFYSHHMKSPKPPIRPFSPTSPTSPKAPTRIFRTQSGFKTYLHNSQHNHLNSRINHRYLHNHYHKFHKNFKHFKNHNSKKFVVFDDRQSQHFKKHFDQISAQSGFKFKPENPEVNIIKRKNLNHKTRRSKKTKTSHHGKKEIVVKDSSGVNHKVIFHKSSQTGLEKSDFFKNLVLGTKKPE